MARIKGKDDLVKSQQRGGRRSGGGGGRRSRMDESYLEEMTTIPVLIWVS
jgi:hypothetical protein